MHATRVDRPRPTTGILVSVTPTPPTLADIGEDGAISRILARVRPHADVLLGPGDDAAVSRIAGPLVTTADMLVEGEDFLLDWLDARRLGVKAAAQNLADVCAMGARPHGLLLSLAAPGSTPASVVERLVDGLVEEASRAGAALIGGDLSGGDRIVVSVTALGDLEGRPALTRSGARAGDDLVLAGTVGRAAAGLDLLFAGRRLGDPDPDVDALIDSQLSPRPDYAAAAALAEAGSGHALIDLSDGLASDLTRMLTASSTAAGDGLGAVLDAQAVRALAAPLLPAARALGMTDEDALRWALTGGEDHGLLAAVAPGTAPVGWAKIGSIAAAAGIACPGLDAGGALAGTGGFRHFAEG